MKWACGRSENACLGANFGFLVSNKNCPRLDLGPTASDSLWALSLRRGTAQTARFWGELGDILDPGVSKGPRDGFHPMPM